MAYVNFTLNEIWNFQSACTKVADQILCEIDSYKGAVSAAVTKYESAINVYNETYTNLDCDYRTLGIVIEDNKHAIEKLKRIRDAAKNVFDHAPNEARAAAKSRYQAAQDDLEDAIRFNEDLECTRNNYWQRMQETLQSIKVCEDAIQTLNNNAAAMESTGKQYISLVYQVEDAAKKAHSYADSIVECLKVDGVSGYYHGLRVRLLDHEILISISNNLHRMGERFDERNASMEEANYNLEYSMSDKITRAAIMKMRDIEQHSQDAGASLKKLSRKTREAYNYVIDYLNLKMSFR